MRNASGFSLMEMMVVIAIMAVLVAIAIPNILGSRPKHVLLSATDDLQSSVQFARIAAIKGRSDVVLKFNAAKDEFRVFVDDGAGGGIDGNGTRDGSERSLRFKRLPAGVSITSVDPAIAGDISFNSRGLTKSGSIKEIDLASTQGETRIIKVSMAGITKVQ